jgi:hypothetical protein
MSIPIDEVQRNPHHFVPKEDDDDGTESNFENFFLKKNGDTKAARSNDLCASRF